MIRDGYFPVFLVWQTGAFDTYFEQITRVRNGELKNNVQISTPLYLAGDVGEGIIRSPITLWNSVIRYWESTAQVEPQYKVGDDIKKAKDPDTYPLYRNVTISDRHEKEGNLAARELLHGLGMPVRLATAPILDAMGKTAWENMVRRTRTTVRTVWEHQADLRGKDFDEQVRCFPRGTGVFAKFFQALQQYSKGRTVRDNAYDDCGIYRGPVEGKRNSA